MGTMRDAYQRLADVIEPVADEELFAVDRWQWLSGEALVETILWDSSRHYDAHREHLERLSRIAVTQSRLGST